MTALFETNSFELLKATLNALPDGVLLVDAERNVIYYNETFPKIWRIPHDLLLRGSSQEMVGFVRDQVDDPKTFSSQVEQLYSCTDSSRDEIKLKDGRTLIRRCVFFENPHFNNARIWIFTDISQIKNLEKDPLTQLFNRKKFEDEFSLTLTHADQRFKKAVALIDIDNFKKYNDTYGHAAGDNVIRQVGRLILDNLKRQEDRGYRVGGEEFLLICLGRTEKLLIDHIESIRQKVENLQIPHIGNENYGVVTISVGLSVFTGSQNSDKLYNCVDQALYLSKKNGRNRLSIAPD